MKTKESTRGQRRHSLPRVVSRVELLNWALGNMSTPHLRRLKAAGETAVEMVQRARTEGNGHKFEVERLQLQLTSLYEGNRRWREEALAMHKSVEKLRESLAALTIAEDMRTQAMREIAAWVKAANVRVSDRPEKP